MLNRAVLFFCEEYPIAAGYLTDRLGRPSKKRPPFGLRPPEFGVFLQHLWRVMLRVESDRNKGNLSAELRPECVLDVYHLLGHHWADIRACGINEGQRYDPAVKIGERYRHPALGNQREGRR